MPLDASQVAVSNQPDAKRFEARADAALIGTLDYIRTPDQYVFTHTEVLPAHEGQGMASVLIRGALDAARAEGMRVFPVCPFVKLFLQRHPDYQDLLP